MTRPRGIDISHWQVFYRPQASVDFIVQKLTEGIYRDPSYTTLKTQIQSVPIKGGYHYIRGAWPWQAQMDVFLSQLEGYDFWALDVEKQGNYSGLPILNKPVPGFVESVPLALEYLKKYSSLPGLLYTGPGVWMDWLKPIWSELLPYDLWVAHYWSTPNPEGVANYFTIKGAETMRKDWKFWQVAAKRYGKEYGVGSLDVDRDVFNGTLEELYVWVHPGVTQPPVPLTLEQRVERLEALHQIT